MTEHRLPTLIAVAHGTRSGDGVAEIEKLTSLVRAARPDVRVELCWLELASPLLRDELAVFQGPAVVVPLLLSTGYHVKIDLAGIVGNRPETAVTRQLGPDRRITDVLWSKLAGDGVDPDCQDIVLFASGSSDPEAAENLAEVAAQLSDSTRCRVFPRFLTDKNWRDGVPDGAAVANYLLAPGFFNDQLHAFARQLSSSGVGKPIGADPAVAAVVLERYEEAARALLTAPGCPSNSPPALR